MNRAEFVNEVAKCKKVSHGNAYRSVNAVMDTIRLALMHGESIEIGGFGTFTVVTDLKGERIPVFKGGRALKKVLNAEESKGGGCGG
jgi:nucleoid DNA-binding protein